MVLRKSRAPDAYDGVDFPGASRRRRLAELFVHLKGHDIRIVAASEIYRYPPGERPWTDDQDMCFQAVVGFAPPRAGCDEEDVAVSYDGGRDVVLPDKPLF